MVSDEEIREVIMPLLMSGAKMLDRHCPKCGSPLFEKDGRVFCPVCEHRKREKASEMKGVELRRGSWRSSPSSPIQCPTTSRSLRNT